MASDAASISRFLSLIGPSSKHGLYIQFRVLAPRQGGGHYPLSQFWSDKSPSSINPQRVYFFSPGLRPYGKNTVTGSFCAWLDFDKLAFDALPSFHLQPSAIISTGGGFHVYWCFSDFVYGGDLAFTLEQLLRVYPAADVLCKDVTRFLRWPSSYNLKYDPPRLVDIVQFSYSFYNHDDFLRSLLAVNLPPAPRAPSPPSEVSGLTSVSWVGDSVVLYHADTGRDSGGVWYFWQNSKPYDIGGELHAVEVPLSSYCRVYTLGGSVLLYEGLLRYVPSEYIGYLSEVVIFADKAAVV